MKKYSNYKKNINNKVPFLIGVFLVCSLFFVAVGFSSLSTTLSIDGSTSFVPVGLIRVMSIEQDTLNNATERNASITPDSIKTTIDLNNINSTATYTVVIKNLGEVDYQLEDINEKLFSNDQVEYILNGFHIGDVIEAKEAKTFTVTFKYKDGISEPLEPRINSELEFVFEEYMDVSGYTKYYNKLVFDGTNYVDTGVELFSAENLDKDFEIYFEITPGQNTVNQATILSCKDETGSPWPGIAYRLSSATDYELSASTPNSSNKPKQRISTTESVTIKRENGILYLKTNNGNFTQVLDMSNITTPFDVPVTFGSSLTGDGVPQRYFTGTLEHVYIKLIDPEKYTVAYNANGGTGSMNNQKIRMDITARLSANTFTKNGYAFSNWNTKPDGTGVAYNDEQQVSNLAANGETITLYAQWLQEFNYTVAYNANSGVGSMESQQFQFGETKNLRTNEFTKTNNMFVKWNTQPDGTGTDYEDGQSVKNLTQTVGDTVTLYAIWMPITYEYSGEYVFTGSNYINTGIYLFCDATKNKNFEIYFEIVSRTSSTGQATLVSCKDETGSPWPGFSYRVASNTEYELSASNYYASQKPKSSTSTTEKVSIKRENKYIYIKINDGEYTRLLDMSRIPSSFDVPVTFGSSLDGNLTPWRYFVGTLKDMRVTVYD